MVLRFIYNYADDAKLFSYVKCEDSFRLQKDIDSVIRSVGGNVVTWIKYY